MWYAEDKKTGYGRWSGIVRVPAGQALSYKYRVGNKGCSIVQSTWELGENRKMSTPQQGRGAVFDRLASPLLRIFQPHAHHEHTETERGATVEPERGATVEPQDVEH